MNKIDCSKSSGSEVSKRSMNRSTHFYVRFFCKIDHNLLNIGIKWVLGPVYNMEDANYKNLLNVDKF